MHAVASGEYEGEGALRVPAWPARITVLFGSALVVFTYVVDRNFRRRAAGERPGRNPTRGRKRICEDAASCSAILT